MSFKEKAKHGYQKFSDGTSMHGFTELFYSKTLFWKIVWSLLVIGSIVVTIYQVTGAVLNYVNQGSNTIIVPVEKEKIQYPPLKFCVGHWIFWLNWTALFERGFTKPSILVGMSYLTSVFSSQYFEENEAKENFTRLMYENNITTMMQFYKIFAKERFQKTYRDVFEEIEFLVGDMGNLYLCYVAPGKTIKNALKQNAKRKTYSEFSNRINVLVIGWPQPSRGEEIDDEEYNRYMWEWIQTKTTNHYSYVKDSADPDEYMLLENDYTKVAPPNILFVDGYSESGIMLSPEIDEYMITVKAGATLWKNTNDNKCDSNVVNFLSNTSCQTKCYHKSQYCNYMKYSYDFPKAIKTSNSTEPLNLVPNGINILLDTFPYHTSNSEVEPTITTTALTTFVVEPTIATTTLKTTITLKAKTKAVSPAQPKITTKSTSTTAIAKTTGATTGATTVLDETNDDYENNYHDYGTYVETCTFTEEIYSNCVTELCQNEGCEVWSFDISVTTKSLNHIVDKLGIKNWTTAIISYPMSGDVLMIMETDSKTWEDFIGNVGGLLGIWTGASILSIFQIIYLCCFADMKGQDFSLPIWIKRQHLHQTVKVENVKDGPTSVFGKA